MLANCADCPVKIDTHLCDSKPASECDVSSEH